MVLEIGKIVDMAAVGEAVRRGFASEISVYDDGNAFNDDLCASIKPERAAPYVAGRLEAALGNKVFLAENRACAEALLEKASLEWPREGDLVRLAQGGQFIPRKYFRGGKVVESVLTASRPPARTLVVARNGLDCGVLTLKNGLLSYQGFQNGCFRLAMQRLDSSADFLEWLKGLLPDRAVLERVCRRIDFGAVDAESAEGVFNLIERFGRFLAGGISFRNPLETNGASDAIYPLKDSSPRGMPAYASKIGFPWFFFPGQESGFPICVDNGFWNADSRSNYYFLPAASYGDAAIVRRVQSLMLAQSMGISHVQHLLVDYGELRGLALKRFDIFAGSSCWRASCDLPGAAELCEADKMDLLRRCAFGMLWNFNPFENLCVVQRKASVYPGTGVDAVDVVFKGETGGPFEAIRLAPFAGVAKAEPGGSISAREMNLLGGALGLEQSAIDLVVEQMRKFEE